eukprot:TRINITY_DN45379_c0_g1_i1.p1 TRINITY_DN45379_c0_g1~~TRINITY_DN45379_c0_g1_i1.p1  ORF type:complete len:453 (-),score=50.44 TRINITY_DN45379_c0_g1_i1:53-1270(-)
MTRALNMPYLAAGLAFAAMLAALQNLDSGGNQEGRVFLLPSKQSAASKRLEAGRGLSPVLLTGAAGKSGAAGAASRKCFVGSSLMPFAALACAAAALRAQVIRRAKGKPQTTSGIRVRKPKNNALRNCSIATFEEITTKHRYEPLVFRYVKRFARPKGKSIHMATRTARKSGHQHTLGETTHAMKYRIIDFGRKKRDMFGTIETIEYDPYRNTRICLIGYEDGTKMYILYALGFFVGQQIIASKDAPVFVGNAMPLDKVPIGTMVHNVEMHPERGGALVRAAGTAAIVLSREGENVSVKMPSSEVRLLSKNCWCTIGKVGRPEAQLIKLGKAGKSHHLGRTPHVRGSAKNACDHPHGGGEGRSPIGHRHPKTRFGKCAHGLVTRRKGQMSERKILIKRTRKSGRK